MKPYPKFIKFDLGNDTRKVRLYHTDPDTNVGIYYNLVGNLQIGVGWSIAGLLTMSDDPDLNCIKCYEITKAEFYN